MQGSSKGSIAYRLIDENLEIYYRNLEKIKRFPEEIKNNINDIQQIDNIKSYNNYLTQTNITIYNEMIGGVSMESGEKIQGINEKINLYCQKNNIKLPRLEPLYKMILSDRQTNSFVIENIENDDELIKTIDDFINSINISEDINLEDENIFIKYSNLGKLPKISYNLIMEKNYKNYDEKYGDKKRNKNYEENRKKTLEKEDYTLKKINYLLEDEKIDVRENLGDKYKELIDNYKQSKENFEKIDWLNIKNIRQSKNTIVIKEMLDSIKRIQNFYSLFDIVTEDNDPSIGFYNWLMYNSKQIDQEFNQIYNKTRNYLTKKQYSNEKFKLNFDAPTLAAGWDINKEKDNLSIILRKFNNARSSYDYFLGIWKKDTLPKEKELKISNSGEFEKMEYKLYPDPAKMLPKQFMSKKWKKEYPVTEEFENKYKMGLHKKGNEFNKEFLHELIEHFKYGLKKHKEKYQKVFEFDFKETKDYNSYAEFIEDVEKNNYKISFNKVTEVDKLVEEGKLYLFQIWSKDFSIYSKGTKNLNTIYFESLFSEENIKEKIFKLSGNAELFYREKSIEYDEKIEKYGHHYDELKDKFNYPIIKDRRFTEDKFMFHIPMEINFRSENLSPKKLNERINDNIEDFTHVIGIDRGERHLIYISVVEIKTGKIVEQKHLDEIINIDTKGNKHKTSYLKKLEEKAATRDKERKSWETIETIKELKEGYISQVVNEIIKLQKEYKGVIVLENLNMGFKNSRIKVEKGVYQKFETAIIKKLNYVIDKKDESTYLKGYQLTNEIETLDKIGSQSGIIFYIPAWNTSKIDPTTGFVNLISNQDLRYKSKKGTKDFIEKIEKIYFEDNLFKFDIDFEKWNNKYVNSQRKWILTSYGHRIETKRNKENNNMWTSEEIDLTEEFEKILNKDGFLKNEDVETYKRFMYLFKLMLQMRNSKTGTDIDYMISPVVGKFGKQYDSRETEKYLPEILPVDADANGAYNIARKGIMVIENIKNENKKPYKITNEEYLKYLQKY